MEGELAAMVPADVVAPIDQDQTGVLMSCSGGRRGIWSRSSSTRPSCRSCPSPLASSCLTGYAERRLL